MVRSAYHIVHGMLPVTSICTNHYSQEKVMQFLTNQIGLVSPLKAVTLPSAPSQLLKMDKVGGPWCDIVMDGISVVMFIEVNQVAKCLCVYYSHQ